MLCDNDQYLIRQNVNLLTPEALSFTLKHQLRVRSAWWIMMVMNHLCSCYWPNRVNSKHDNAITSVEPCFFVWKAELQLSLSQNVMQNTLLRLIPSATISAGNTDGLPCPVCWFTGAWTRHFKNKPFLVIQNCCSFLLQHGEVAAIPFPSLPSCREPVAGRTAAPRGPGAGSRVASGEGQPRLRSLQLAQGHSSLPYSNPPALWDLADLPEPISQGDPSDCLPSQQAGKGKGQQVCTKINGSLSC